MKSSSSPDRSWKPLRPAVLIGLGVFISTLGVWWIARVVDLDRLSRALQTVEPAWLLIAVLAITLTLFTRTWRWIILLRPLLFRSTTIMTALLSGQLLNFVLPLRLGDVARSALLSRAPGSSFARVLGSIVIEKAWDWLALCAIVIIALLITPLPGWFSAPARVVGLIAGGILLVFVLATQLSPASLPRGVQRFERGLPWLPARWRTFLIANLQRLLDSLIALRRRSSVIGTAWWSCVTWGLGVVANYAVMRAYSVDTWSAALLLEVVLMIGVALPPSIAAIGIFEGLTILTLSAFNLSLEVALTIGLALHVIIFLPPLIMWGALVVWRAIASPERHLGRVSS